MVFIFVGICSIGQTKKRSQCCTTSGIKNPIPKATFKVKEAWYKTRPIINKGWIKTKKVTGDGIQTIKEKVNKYKLKQKNKRNSSNKAPFAGSCFIFGL